MTPTVSPASLSAADLANMTAQANAICNNQDSIALANFATACSNWTAQNLQLRANGKATTDKPTQPKAWHAAVSLSADGTQVISVFTLGPDVLGQPCPDLPSATIPTGTVSLGAQLTGVPGAPAAGNYFACGATDTTPGGKTVSIGGHTYLKVQSPGAATTNSDGSVPGWYLMLS